MCPFKILFWNQKMHSIGLTQGYFDDQRLCPYEEAYSDIVLMI